MKFIIVLLLALILLFSGCSSVRPGKTLYIEQKGPHEDKMVYWSGSAAVIGKDKIVTAYHVVDEQSPIRIKVGKFPRRYVLVEKYYVFLPNEAKEPYVILKVKGKYRFKKKDIYKIATSWKFPDKVYTRRGIFKWDIYTPRGGDSGSPVVNKYDELIGVVWGWRDIDGDKEPIYIPVKQNQS